MAKAMTKTEICKKLAEANDMKPKEAKLFLESLAALAYKQAKNGFTIPGLGKLVKVRRKARWGRNPQTQEKIRIKAKTKLAFRVAKAAKDAIL